MRNKSNFSKKHLYTRLIQLGVLVAVVLTFVYGSHSIHMFYKSIFRLTSDQVHSSLSGAVSTCDTVAQCRLIPGDILIRRYITERTRVMDRWANLYFTHVAFYIGDNQLVEAGGIEQNRQDDIQVKSFSNSDWVASDLGMFVVIRPKKYAATFAVIKSNLIGIANDPGFSFGFPWQGYKKTTCAELVFRQLQNEGLIDDGPNVPEIITPDYIFWYALNHSNEFDVVGFSKY